MMEEWWETFARRRPLAARLMYYPSVTILGLVWVTSVLALLWMLASLFYAVLLVSRP